jgi:hypothetical protein
LSFEGSNEKAFFVAGKTTWFSTSWLTVAEIKPNAVSVGAFPKKSS